MKNSVLFKMRKGSNYGFRSITIKRLNQKLYAYRNQKRIWKIPFGNYQTNKQEIKDMHSEFLDKRDFNSGYFATHGRYAPSK